MKTNDLALSLIRAPLTARLFDRAFIVPVLFCCAVWVAAIAEKTSFDRAIEFSQWVLATFIGAEKAKDAVVGFGALKWQSQQETENPKTPPSRRENDAELADREGDDWGENQTEESPIFP